MQVTDEMVAAALRVLFGPGATPDAALRAKVCDAMQAALDVAGNVDLPVTATVRVQIDEPAFHASVADAVNRLHAGLPRDEQGRITIASLGDAGPEKCCVCGSAKVVYHNYKQQPFCGPCADGDRPKSAQQHIPVAEPRALIPESQLHLHLGEKSRQFIEHVIANGLGGQPPFPQPVRHTDVPEPLYDPDAVKAWYDALPQAADDESRDLT